MLILDIMARCVQTQLRLGYLSKHQHLGLVSLFSSASSGRVFHLFREICLHKLAETEEVRIKKRYKDVEHLLVFNSSAMNDFCFTLADVVVEVMLLLLSDDEMRFLSSGELEEVVLTKQERKKHTTELITSQPLFSSSSSDTSTKNKETRQNLFCLFRRGRRE